MKNSHKLINFHNQAFAVMVHTGILRNQFLFMTGICYCNLQKQQIKVPENIGYIIELTVHATAIKVTATLAGSTMSCSQL